jgi:hypothetical protein
MIKRVLITLSLSFTVLPCIFAQGTSIEREITLYNPYQPSLNAAAKRSFLPDLQDTIQTKPQFRYDVNAQPLMPQYTISPIKAASLLPDPLPKLYKSYINAGIGSHLSGLGEISIANERSKKGAIGFYGRHFSSSGKIKLDNKAKVNAGYMDNEVSLFGKKFFNRSTLEGSVDFTQQIRHAFGYDTAIVGYVPEKDSIKMKYNDIGGKISFLSTDLDSNRLYYNFNLSYDHFFHKKNFFRNRILVDGLMAKSVNSFYVGSGINYELYKPADSLSLDNEFIFAISPFLKKSTSQWSFKLGLELLLDRVGDPHIYPNISFGFAVVPSYINFFANLDGYLERNDPLKIAGVNPYLSNSQSFRSDSLALFRLPDTDHQIVVSAGLKGSNGIGGRYLISTTYSVINDMLFYSNVVSPDTVIPRAMGNYFVPVVDMGNIFNIHGEISGKLSDKLSFGGTANIYKYDFEKTWNKPSWDAKLELDYNLRDKILAGINLTSIGTRTNVVNADYHSKSAGYKLQEIEMPAHFNVNLKAEYRYSKILSFSLNINNISFKDYYEWAFYPSHRFLVMAGFKYSL